MSAEILHFRPSRQKQPGEADHPVIGLTDGALAICIPLRPEMDANSHAREHVPRLLPLISLRPMEDVAPEAAPYASRQINQAQAISQYATPVAPHIPVAPWQEVMPRRALEQAWHPQPLSHANCADRGQNLRVLMILAALLIGTLFVTDQLSSQVSGFSNWIGSRPIRAF